MVDKITNGIGIFRDLVLLAIACMLVLQFSFWIGTAMAPPALEILKTVVATKTADPGGKFSFVRYYRKNRDCPGRWIYRWRRAGSHATPVFATGALGTRDPGEYKYELEYPVPDGLASGDVFEIRGIYIMHCDGGTSISRSEWVAVKVR